MENTLTPVSMAVASLATTLMALPGLNVLRKRWLLSRAKHRSLAGHSRLAKRLARWLPGHAHGPESFFTSDGALAEVAAKRRAGFERLARELAAASPLSVAATRRASQSISDLQFTSRYRVPYPYAEWVRQHMALGSVVRASDGVMLEDLDGTRRFDLTGSYGVNLFGNDFYKACIAEGVRRAEALGPVLGSLHPCVAENAERLRALSGLDEVSFHMSGTEAVMQAVRLARYHTRRKYLVRFCGAYHGWWEDVQPGPGNPLPPRETYTLRDLCERSLDVLRSRRDIACVLVNPLQALHPNANAPADSGLIDGSRQACFDRAAYSDWLRRLRQVCSERGIVFILDEIFVGFRLAPGGAQQYFGVKADMVTYGKTLGGGLPVGVVCAKRELMQRWREGKPADVCLARGTFNAHPYVMTTMASFLDRLAEPAVAALYEGLDERWNARAQALNTQLAAAHVPVRVANLSTIWTVLYTQAGRYHWMLQYYLRRHGLALSWVGSGRLIFSLNYGDAELEAVCERFVAACLAMQADGWWWQGEGSSREGIRRDVLRRTWAAWFSADAHASSDR